MLFLRDMDAILGRDDRLVAKLADAVTKLDAKFAAIIGTPVPAVIGTDYHALKRMTEKKVDLPILTVDTDGKSLISCGVMPRIPIFPGITSSFSPANTRNNSNHAFSSPLSYSSMPSVSTVKIGRSTFFSVMRFNAW